MGIDITKIVTLVDAGNTKEAEQLLKDYLANMTSEDRGQMYVSIGATYFELLAKNQKKLADLLMEQAKDLEYLSKEESLISDEVNLESIREQLK